MGCNIRKCSKMVHLHTDCQLLVWYLSRWSNGRGIHWPNMVIRRGLQETKRAQTVTVDNNGVQRFSPLSGGVRLQYIVSSQIKFFIQKGLQELGFRNADFFFAHACFSQSTSCPKMMFNMYVQNILAILHSKDRKFMI